MQTAPRDAPFDEVSHLWARKFAFARHAKPIFGQYRQERLAGVQRQPQSLLAPER